MLACLAAVPLGVHLRGAPGTEAVASAALVARGVSGVFFLVASLLLYVDWRVRPTARKAWLVPAMVLLACQLLGSTALALDPAYADDRLQGWSLVVDLCLTAAVVAMAGISLEDRPPRGPEPLLTGLGLGAVGTVAKPALQSLDTTLPVAPSVIMAAIVAAYGLLAVAVLLRHSLPPWLAWRLALTLVLISGSNAAATLRFPGTLLDLASSTLLVLGGVLWASAAFALLRTTLESDRRRLIHIESSLLAVEGSSRVTKEALHELKSTVAGLAKASQLLSDASIAPDVRHRLEQMLVLELARIERRLWPSATVLPEVIDLDLTLDAVLELHRVRGRTFAWTPSGASVVGRGDAIAEAVNILLDNAATHGDATTGRVEVTADDADATMVRIAVSDDGPGVPLDLRQRIFEWGERGPASPGQGIGLNLAQRLVSEQGGSLTLSEMAHGSSFVIRLPAARRSEETVVARADRTTL